MRGLLTQGWPARGDALSASARRGRTRVGAIVSVVAAIASAGALTACGSPASSATSASGASAGTAAVSLATSLDGTGDTWAVLPVSANPSYWEVFVRPARSVTWKLVTPPGVADNGGLVAASTGGSLTVAVRPTEDLLFSPLASTADAGASWSTGGPLSAGLAASPDALAADGASLVAVLGDGTIATSANAGSSWQTLAKPGAIAGSPAGRGCGTVAVTSVSFGVTDSHMLAAGSCGASGTTAIFSYTASGGWHRLSLPVSGPLVRFAPGLALVRAKAGLIALWDAAVGWYAYAPVSPGKQPAAAWTASAPLPVTGAVTASGTLAGGGAWVLLPGGRAATIAGPLQQWLLLPPVPATTSVLAAGPNGAVDALAVTGATLTVWRLAHGATVWTKIQAIAVPVQYGSSS